MDIKTIKTIVNGNQPNDIKEMLVIGVLATDKNAIPMVMKILETERKSQKELVQDLNLELSRAHIYIDMRPEQKKESKESFNKGFLLDEISKFYIKYKGKVTHCFNRFN